MKQSWTDVASLILCKTAHGITWLADYVFQKIKVAMRGSTCLDLIDQQKNNYLVRWKWQKFCEVTISLSETLERMEHLCYCEWKQSQ